LDFILGRMTGAFTWPSLLRHSLKCHPTCHYEQGCGFGGFWVESMFCPRLVVQLDHFLHHTPKLGIPVEMVQFLSKLLLKQISCCAPRFRLILTAKFHSLYVKEYFTSDSATLTTRATTATPVDVFSVRWVGKRLTRRRKCCCWRRPNILQLNTEGLLQIRSGSFSS